MTAYVLAAALVVLLVPVRAWAGIKPVEINKNSNATPIHPVEMQVTVGDLVLLAVNNDNFEWEDEDENVVNGSDEAFTMQMVRELGLVVYPPSVDPHFGMPELVVEQGKLYIAAEALLPSAGTVLAVGLMDKTRGQIEPCAVPVAILQKDSGGSGGEEPGGGDDGDGNDGGDEGSGGNGGEAPGDGGSGGDGANGSDGGDPEPGERPETTEGLSIGGFSDGFELRRRLGAASAVTRTGGVIHIPFQAGDFQWYDALGRAVEPEDTAVVTLPQIKAAGLEVRLTGGERQAVVEAVYLAEEGGSGGVAVRLVERLLSLEDVSFIAQLVVSCNGVYSEGALQGLVEIPIETPDNSIGWLDLQEGIVVQPEEQIADIQLYLGGGVTMRASLEQGGRYSGIALREAVNGAAGDVESVCSLYLLGGLEQRGVFVIEHEAARYIYDDEGAYLGMSGEELPYRALYYISTVEPDGGDGNGGSGSGSGSGSGGSGGSSGAYKHPSISSVPERFYNQESTTSMTEPRVPAGAPANANDNPSTGK